MMYARKNPPSHGFTRIGAGSFATAYSNQKGKVELIIRPVINTDRYGNETSTEYELSREILIIARDMASRSAKRFLPEISRERIELSEIDGFEAAEIVYSMPLYCRVTSEENKRLIGLMRKGELEKAVAPNGLIEAFSIVSELAKKYPCQFDMTDQNFSESNSGHLILRDLLVIVSTGYDFIRISNLWPEKDSRIFGISPVRVEEI